jgi:hypothetical protein
MVADHSVPSAFSGCHLTVILLAPFLLSWDHTLVTTLSSDNW